MTYSFHPLAEEELNKAVDYYNDCKSELGYDFLNEVYIAIQNIIQFPNAQASLSKNTKRCLTNRFPYGIIYQITNNEIIIIAVMQLNRKPDYWNKRIN